MAKSRRPTPVPRSQPASSAATAPGSSARGRDPPAKPAGVGTAQTSCCLMWPARNKNRSSDRSPVTSTPAAVGRSWPHRPTAKLLHLRRSELSQVQPAWLLQTAQEQPGRGQIGADGRVGQAPLAHQVAAVVPSQFLRRRARGRRHPRNHAQATQVAQQRRERPPRQQQGVAGSAPRQEESRAARRCVQAVCVWGISHRFLCSRNLNPPGGELSPDGGETPRRVQVPSDLGRSHALGGSSFSAIGSCCGSGPCDGSTTIDCRRSDTRGDLAKIACM